MSHSSENGHLKHAASATARTIAARQDEPLAFVLNGASVWATVDPRQTLLDLLRENFKLTGTKLGCNHGQCGACTVLLDGRRVLSCLKLSLSVEGRNVKTVEGLSDDPLFAELQSAFIEHDAFQCGYCTSGQLVSAFEVIRTNPTLTAESVREQMSGNICRCGAYNGIVDAILDLKSRASV